MIRENSSKQQAFDFMLPFEGNLDEENRWVKLAASIPWDELSAVYHQALNSNTGAPAKPARLVLGVLILQHIKNLTDEGVIEDIKENPYYQYFLGFKNFTNKPVFAPSLLVKIRKRLRRDKNHSFNSIYLNYVNSKIDKSDDFRQRNTPTEQSDENEIVKPLRTKKRGVLILDATVVPSDIHHPSDLLLLSKAREESEQLIDAIWALKPNGIKPRSYRLNARKHSILHSKKQNQNGSRKSLGGQLRYLRRNLGHIEKMLDRLADSQFNQNDFQAFPLPYAQQRLYWIIQELYRQQDYMWRNKVNRIDNRIVSISQPHVRPIKRGIAGKAGEATEFGAKLSAILLNGFIYLDKSSWSKHNESRDLINAVEMYKMNYGYYPESVNCNKIYRTWENKIYLKNFGIKMYDGSHLGRPRKE